MKVPLPISSNPSFSFGDDFLYGCYAFSRPLTREAPRERLRPPPPQGDNAYRMGSCPDLVFFSPPIDTRPCFYPVSHPLVP